MGYFVGQKFRYTSHCPWSREDGTKGVEKRTAICVVTLVGTHGVEYKVETIEAVVDPLHSDFSAAEGWTMGGFNIAMAEHFKAEWL